MREAPLVSTVAARDRASVTLTFSRRAPHNPVSVRAAFFRICADSTLRAPDSSVIATFNERRWILGNKGCSEFTCNGPVFLRITRHDGIKERLGPYEFVRAAEGALFTKGQCLGTHSIPGVGSNDDGWEEITLLPPFDLDL
jgi:hypothetical protein